VNTTKIRRSATERQLNAYVESWQTEHHEAMKCVDWEDIIAVGICVYKLLRFRDKSEREMILRGISGHPIEDILRYRDCLDSWLTATRSVLASQINPLERNYTVNGANELRACASAASDYLADWLPPRVSSALGLREIQLDDASATELNRIIAEANVNPTPMPSGPPMEELSLADFRSRSESN